ncbi:hypothetical protein BJX99DRAFT_242454 [Aspergillus californicus]
MMKALIMWTRVWMVGLNSKVSLRWCWWHDKQETYIRTLSLLELSFLSPQAIIMGFSLSMLPRRQPYPAQVNQQQAHLDYQYRKAHRELVADRNRLNEISEDNGRLSRQVEDLKRQHLLDSERIQRQHELLSKACEEVTSRNEDHQRELSNLYAKLNALQSTESLTDEQILGEMRRLSQHLESWIKSNFKDGEKLAARFHNADGFHRSSPQRRAWIQAHITDLVQRHIFAASRFGLPNNPWGQLITEIEAGVQRNCPSPGSS